MNATLGGLSMGQKALLLVLLVGLVIMSSGCGTIFWGYRAGLPPEQRTGVDVLVLVLDLFFFFPISIIVDLATGCIYTYGYR